MRMYTTTQTEYLSTTFDGIPFRFTFYDISIKKFLDNCCSSIKYGEFDPSLQAKNWPDNTKPVKHQLLTQIEPIFAMMNV